MKHFFTLDQFADVPGHQGSTAEAKLKFANQLATFVDEGFPKKKFGAIYPQLRNLFGHIAHYDRDGFYAVWFSTKDQQLAWFKAVLGGSHFSGQWADVERVFQEWLKPRAACMERKASEERELKERAQLRSLIEKYPDEIGRTNFSPAPSCAPDGWDEL